MNSLGFDKSLLPKADPLFIIIYPAIAIEFIPRLCVGLPDPRDPNDSLELWLPLDPDVDVLIRLFTI
jgi:hypothetical protein